MNNVKSKFGTGKANLFGGDNSNAETPEGVEFFTVDEAKELGWRITNNVKRTNRKVLDNKKKPIITGYKDDAKKQPIYKTEPGERYVKVFTDPNSSEFFIAFLSLKLRDNYEVGDKLNADDITIVTIEEGTTLGKTTFETDTILIGTKGGNDTFL